MIYYYMVSLLATNIALPDVVNLLNYGVLGIVVVLIFLRKLVPGQFWQEERDARIASDIYVRETLIPLVQDMTKNQEKSNDLLLSFKHERDDEIAELRLERKERLNTRFPSKEIR